MLENLPVLGICGYKNSGKTTLIEQVLPHLTGQELLAVVVKSSSHHADIDISGKDTDRLFQSGADVLFSGPQGNFFRIHSNNELHDKHDSNLLFVLRTLSRRYDIVLFEGRSKLPFAKVWLTSSEKDEQPPDTDGIIATFPMDSSRAGKLESLIDDWLPKQWMKTPVFGCVLIGGKSTRMGTPKHLILENGATWLERTAEMLSRVTEQVFITGGGSVPDSLKDITRLPDIPGASGPTAGILSAMRWAPNASFIVTACDLPDLSPEALQWLLSNRRPGIWAVFPKLTGNSNVEPLLSYYDVRARELLEQAAAEGFMSLSHIASHQKVAIVTPPVHIASAWRNINTSGDLGSR